MEKGMIVQCGSCGMLENISLEGSQSDIEQTLGELIDAAGWRFTKKYHGWICRDCQNGKTDPLYDQYFGKPRPCTKMESWEEIKQEAARQLAAFRKLEGLRK